MAKGKKKPASKPQAKKTEPILKDEAIPVEDTTAPKEKAPKEKKAKAPKKVKAKEKKKDSHSFPKKEKCKHTNTKRTIDRRLRVMHVCTECGVTVRFGGR